MKEGRGGREIKEGYEKTKLTYPRVLFAGVLVDGFLPTFPLCRVRGMLLPSDIALSPTLPLSLGRPAAGVSPPHKTSWRAVNSPSAGSVVQQTHPVARRAQSSHSSNINWFFQNDEVKFPVYNLGRVHRCTQRAEAR
eukprot:356232-Chlamydomonas_euryale.AAC.20